MRRMVMTSKRKETLKMLERMPEVRDIEMGGFTEESKLTGSINLEDVTVSRCGCGKVPEVDKVLKFLKKRNFPYRRIDYFLDDIDCCGNGIHQYSIDF